MKNKNIIFAFAVLLVLTMHSVYCLGITPGRTTVNFEPNLHKEISFSVLNSEHKDMSVVFMVRGNLSGYVALSQTYAEFSADEDSKSFTYTIDLPSKFDKPGKYDVEIVAMEAPKDLKEKGTFVGATVAVVTQLYVYVPYPNKYAEAELNVVESDGKTVFLVPVINRGKLDIVNLKAVIDIYSDTNEKITTLETDTQSLESLKRTELSVPWESNVNPGRYKALVTVMYDNEITTVFKDFNVGEMFLDILEINVKDFRLGEIAKFDTLVENKWSSDLSEVYLNILVYNNEGEVMADFKSPTYDVGALSQADMVAYWDTAGVHKGTYDGKIILKYGQKSTERNIQLKITDDSIEVTGITGRVVVRGAGGFNLNNILIILVIILIVANIFWFLVIRKFLKKRKD
jgi:hypothetical protein